MTGISLPANEWERRGLIMFVSPRASLRLEEGEIEPKSDPLGIVGI